MSTDSAIREATAADWPRIRPFFDAIVQAGETCAYDPSWNSQEAQRFWTTATGHPGDVGLHVMFLDLRS